MNEEQAKRQAAEAIRRQRLTEKAAEAGLKAIQEKIAETRRQAEAFREASKSCEDLDEQTDMQADAWLCEVEASAMQAAATGYAIAYAAIAGKPPKGAKDAKAINEFAASLYRRRRAAGMTQTELAEAAGVTFATINRIEQGRHEPSLKTRKQIRRALEKAERRKRK